MTGGIVHLSMRWPHHSQFSGYDRLSAYFPEATVLRGLRLGRVQSFYGRLFRRVVRPRIGAHPYGPDNSLLELNGYRHALLRRAGVYHFLYAEESYRLLRVRRAALVASFHHPPTFYPEWGVTGSYLGRLSAVIVLGQTQRKFFEQYLPAAAVHCVPHGVDTLHFAPAPARTFGPELRVLTVGGWLRDHETFRAAIGAANQPGRPPIHFDVVGPAARREFYAGLGAVTYHTGIAEAELLALYHRADLAALPLTDCVANNALLEAMACGLPAIVTDVGAVREYTGPDAALLVAPRDPAALLAGWEELATSAARREALGRAARARAVELDWSVIAERTRAVYRAAQSRVPSR